MDELSTVFDPGNAMAPDPERAKFLFLAAADLPSRDSGAAYLYRECGADTQLLRPGGSTACRR